MKKFETKQLVNKPKNPFQNYDVAKKTLKTNQNFSHYLWKKKHFKRNKSWINENVGNWTI